MLILVILIPIFIVSLSGILIWYFIKKTNPNNNDESEKNNIKTAQEFLPFEDIRENTIVLSKHRYRAIIECSSTNYQLKTPAEKEQIELSFQRFLNSITFPITFFNQTKVIDNTQRLKLLDKEIKETLNEFPNMQEYAEQYKRDMEDLNEKIGNSQQKKRYIIVSYDDVINLDNLSEEEKIHYSAKEIRNRCNIVISNLESVGVQARIMNTEELIELVYSCYYRDDFSYAECIANKDAFKLFIDGENDKFKNMPLNNILNIILNGAINQIKLENIDSNVNVKNILKELKRLKEEYCDFPEN